MVTYLDIESYPRFVLKRFHFNLQIKCEHICVLDWPSVHFAKILTNIETVILSTLDQNEKYSICSNYSDIIYDDISLTIDTGKVTALIILYLSAAYRTIDYSVLLDRVSDWYRAHHSLGSTHS